MDSEEAIHLMVVASTTANDAFKLLEKSWPPDEQAIVRAESLFDQANAGIRDFLESTQGFDNDWHPEIQEARKEARKALSRHERTLKLVRSYLA